MYCNGIIVRRKTDEKYKGVDSCGAGENWYLSDDPGFEAFYDENIERTYYNCPEGSWVSACTDLDYVRKYINESQKRGIKYRLILCETEIPQPQFDPQGIEKTFLGYDYAYTGGDYYSAVYQEVPYVFAHFALNENGLFETEDEIKAYLADREEFVRTHPPLSLEVGDFTVYKLWEIQHL